jgi:hypothetical protein
MNIKIILQQKAGPITATLFLIIGLGCMVATRNEPIRDFGNYYYGSRLLADGNFDIEIYKDIHYFNKQIRGYGEQNFFENYIPVPPISALLYLPFCFFNSLNAKLIFNLLSLLLFCYSFYRLVTAYPVQSLLLLLLPFAFLFPLFNNIRQGQSYLLITAGLIMAFLYSEKKGLLGPALILALIISLKIFPLFIVLYFLVKKKYKMCFAVSVAVILLQLLTFLVIPSINIYYFTHIVPRLFNNDVIGPYYYGNQSFYTLLLNLCSVDGLDNPDPLWNYPQMVVITESVIVSFIIMIIWQIRQGINFAVYAAVIFASVLIGRYSTSYGMFLLLPCGFSLFLFGKNMLSNAIILLILFVTFLPLGGSNSPVLLKYSRLAGLIIVFSLLVFYFKIKPSWTAFLLILIPVSFLKYLTFSIKEANYFYIQNSRGILYDIKADSNRISLFSTVGSEDIVEHFQTRGYLHSDTSLVLRDHTLRYQGRIINNGHDNKRKPFLLNDTTVLFMSDLNQGVRFYKLRTIHL